jgi:hypothetical protein
MLLGTIPSSCCNLSSQELINKVSRQTRTIDKSFPHLILFLLQLVAAAEKGDVEEARRLVENTDVDVNDMDWVTHAFVCDTTCEICLSSNPLLSTLSAVDGRVATRR